MATAILWLITTVFCVNTVLCSHHMIVIDNESEGRIKRNVENEAVLLPDITNFYVVSKVNARFATVDIESQVINKQSTSLDTSFIVQIPEDAFIADFKMVVNGSTFVAKVFAKEEAQKKFEEAQAKNQTAGQVSHTKTDKKRGMEIFRIQVNLAADVQATFFLTYQELLKRDLGKYIQRFVIEPGQIIANLTVTAVYNENQGFESFTYRLPGSLETRVGSSSDSVTVKASDSSRELVYMPTVSDQTTMSAKGLNGELIISYELTHKKDGGVVIVDNEYFVHYVSPTGLEIMDKTILFVIDISGSMGGQKIIQARESMIIILDKLNSNDYFNILLFDGDIMRWLDVPVLANIENIGKAKAYVNEYVKDSGATNINDALLSAIDSLRGRSEESSRSQVIVLLTDGQPSAGETNTKQIRKNVYRRNEGLAAIFCLGFGFSLDWPFLKHLAYENGGFARRIYEDKDAPVQLEHFYLEIKNPVMKNVVISYGSGVESTTKRDFYQYFEGSEIVVSGKTKIPNAFPNQQLLVVGIANTGNNLDLKVDSNSVIVWNKDDSKFTEKLWAYKKIKELLLMAEVYDNATAKSLALNMSLEYNFVTPVTSLVLVQSDEFRLNDLQSGRSNVYHKSGVGSASFLKPSILVIFTLLVLLNYPQL